MIDELLRVVRALVSVLRVLAGVLLVASVLLNFANVVGRYFFNASIYWAEEVMLFLMVGCVFLGNGVVAWSGRQLRMDVIVGMMPAPVRKRSHLFSELVFIACRGRHRGVRLAGDPRSLASSTSAASPPNFRMVIPQAMVPIGLSIMAFLVVVRLLTGGERRQSRTHRALRSAGR